ncbi:trihelix transcription factor GT-3b [Magnolia sinica]|uniref:trihelix transcription factor GT-3b n=1 Tax=Magnolia sinica TaxID=86752 RepID=UPI00265A619F|nr:trihelix transcription factor GT-3b [Magnolia sinica]
MEVHHFNMSNPASNPDGGDRFPQWSLNETREFLAIRSELDRTFMETKRNKLLWDVISSKMKEKGYNRSADQCKCKWKNLVTRYKGSETMEAENMRQFPFYDELRAIFTARMQRLLWLEAEGGGSSSAKKKGLRSSSEDEEESNDDSDKAKGSKKKKRLKSKVGTEKSRGNNSNSRSNVIEALEEFMRQQMQMEVQWREAMEAREEERSMKEMEWRRKMEAIERERIAMDNRWREREEQRRMREEARAEKRDVLLTTLLTKLINDDM